MKKYAVGVFVWLIFTCSCFAELKIVGETKVLPYRMVKLVLEGLAPGAAVVWSISPEEDADLEEVGNKLLFTAPPGVYKIKALSIQLTKEGKTLVDTARTTVTIGEPPPPPGVPTVSSMIPVSGKVGDTFTVYGTNLAPTKKVTLGGVSCPFVVLSDVSLTVTVVKGASSGKVVVSTPQGTATSPMAFTVSDEPPTPPAPIPAPGFRVLMVYESADLAKLPAAQQAILYDKSVRDYLREKCALGPDGKTKEYRIYDKDVILDADSKLWQDVMKRKRDSIPWIVISNSPKGGYEGPLPANVADTMMLLKKYAEM